MLECFFISSYESSCYLCEEICNHTFQWCLLHIYWFNMYFYSTHLRTAVVTVSHLKQFLLFMHWCNMPFYLNRLRTAVVRKFTFEWFLLLMNWCQMSISATFYRTSVIKHFTYEWLLLLMNWCNMLPFIEHLLSQILCTVKLQGLTCLV